MTRHYYHSHIPEGTRQSSAISISTQLIIDEAERCNIKWKEIVDTKMIELSYNNATSYFFQQVPFSTNSLAHFLCNDKTATCACLQHAGIATPRGYKVSQSDTDEYLRTVFDSLNKPLVVKPSAAWGGTGISLHISDFEAFLKAVKIAVTSSIYQSDSATAEEMFAGEEYRILATREKTIGITHRIPANVLGNGKSTIGELIEQKNADPRRGENFFEGKPLLKIKVDQKTLDLLKLNDLNLSSVPSSGERIFLKEVSNLSQGGDSIDYTDRAHPSVHEIAVRAIAAIPGLAMGGVDIITKNITQEQDEKSYVIIEINDSPGIFMHDLPMEGKNRSSAHEFLKLHFPDLE
jgi:glutamate--cysteine ligase